MAKGVFLHRADSIYEDRPDQYYEFPSARYLAAVQQIVGDWIVYYEPGKHVRSRRYFAAAFVDSIVPSPGKPDRLRAIVRPGSYIEFDLDVPRALDGRPFESALAGKDGLLLKHGGRRTEAVRLLPDAEFSAIIELGLPQDLEDREARQYEPVSELAEPVQVFRRPVIERLTRQSYRDVAFRRKVRAAYGYRCALSGLELRNGGGRPEVQAAHIIPVEHGGSDFVRNGLALSGTLHWMFDRGLISVDPQDHRILISHNKVPRDVVDRLIRPEGKLFLPRDRRDWPHPAHLKWHKENRFGSGDFAD